jgi:hypothetical protein
VRCRRSGRYRSVGSLDWRLAWIGWLVIILAWLATLWLESRVPNQHSREWTTLFTAPRTDRPAAIGYARTCGYAATDPKVRKRIQRVTLAKAFAYNPAVVGTMGLSVLSVSLAAVLDAPGRDGPDLLPAAFLASLLSLLALRSWWRISATYRTYLKQGGESQPDRRK